MNYLWFLACLTVAASAPTGEENSIYEDILKAMGGKEGAKSLAYATSPDGSLLAELDMLLTPQQYQALYLEGESSRQKRKFYKAARKWTNNIVPYTMDGSFTSSHKDTVQRAMDHISQKNLYQI